MTTLSIDMLPMELCFASAQKRDPEFSKIAEESILAHLRAVGQASGEDCVDVAIAHGARPHDQRAFGGVFQALSRRKLIRCVGFTLRRKGHQAAGGRLWEAVA
jgi:predicted DNA-binding transcriptional regulator YafY